MASFEGGEWRTDFSTGNGPGRGIAKAWRPVEHPSSKPGVYFERLTMRKAAGPTFQFQALRLYAGLTPLRQAEDVVTIGAEWIEGDA